MSQKKLNKQIKLGFIKNLGLSTTPNDILNKKENLFKRFVATSFTITYSTLVSNKETIFNELLNTFNKDHDYAIGRINELGEIDYKHFDLDMFTFSYFCYFIMPNSQGYNENSLITFNISVLHKRYRNLWYFDYDFLMNKSQKGSYKRGVLNRKTLADYNKSLIKPQSFDDVLRELDSKRKEWNLDIKKK